jgi:ubiquinone/menaquinone biosynthesis C-methylase UbiE
MFGSKGGKIISITELIKILQYLRPKELENILDIGTGTGRIAREIVVTPGCNVVGIDVNKQDVRLANVKKKSLGDHKDRYELIIADGQFLPFKDSCFDSAICIRTIKYFPNPQAGVREASEVIKDGGKFVLTLSNVFSVDFILLRFGILAYKTLFNFRKFARFFKANNLVLINYTGLHKIHPKIWTVFNSTQFLNFLKAAEEVLQRITPKELFSREILVKLIKNNSRHEDYNEHQR